jgi:hypothetical protein
MLNVRRTALAAAILAAFAIPAAYAAGLFPNLPIVGGGSYNAGSGVTVPAGPSTLTGNELIPADTEAAGGVTPQTVFITPCQLSAGAVNAVVPLTGFTVTIPNNACVELLVPAGTLATGTVTMPAAPLDGQIVRLASSATVTALTVSPNTGQTMVPPIPTAITVSATVAYGYAWVFKAAAIGAQPANSWYRLQ